MTGFDAQILLWIQEHLRHPALTAFFRLITRFGDGGIFWIALAVVLILIRQYRKVGMTCLGALAIGAVITNLMLKPLVHRIRPFVTVPAIRKLITVKDPHSFPSGHATASFAMAFVFMRYMPKRYSVPVLVFAVLIAFSRIYLGVHYASDVITGMLIGTVSGLTASLIADKRGIRHDND